MTEYHKFSHTVGLALPHTLPLCVLETGAQVQTPCATRHGLTIRRSSTDSCVLTRAGSTTRKRILGLAWAILICWRRCQWINPEDHGPMPGRLILPSKDDLW